MLHSLNTPLWLGMEWTNIVQEEVILIASVSKKYSNTDVNILSALYF